jgi:hypothetical protein
MKGEVEWRGGKVIALMKGRNRDMAKKTFKGHTVEFFKKDGKVMVTVDGGTAEPAKKAEVDVKPHDAGKFEDTIIGTSHNPTCYWCLFNNQWYYI